VTDFLVLPEIGIPLQFQNRPSVRNSTFRLNPFFETLLRLSRIACLDQQQGEIVFRSLKVHGCDSKCLMGVIILGLVQIIGCGPAAPPPTATVSGQVTYKGKPVSVGQIWFNAPEKGYSANAPLNAEGKYEISKDLPPANYKVYLTPPRITTPPKPGEAPPPTEALQVPDRYQTEQMSGLTANVVAGTQKIDFPLPD